MSEKEELIAWEMLECTMCNPLGGSHVNSNIVDYALFRVNYSGETECAIARRHSINGKTHCS